MTNFIRKPSIDLFPGIRVTKETKLEHTTETVSQTVNALVLHTVNKITGDGYHGTYDVTVELNEGDILIYDEARGYIKPAEEFMTIGEAIEQFENIKDLG